MKLSDFILLNVEEKTSVILHEGILVAKRKNDDYMIFLFQLPGYYIETWCNRNNKTIKEFRAFDSTRPLLPYLEGISIDDLFN